MPKKKISRFLLPCIMAAVILIVLTFSFVDEDIKAYADTEAGKDKIRVGYYRLEGFNDINENGSFNGYGYEYLMEIAKYTGWDYELVHEGVNPETGQKHRLTYDEALTMLKNGELDLVCNVNKTEEAAKDFHFPGFPMGETKGILTVRPENSQYWKGNISALDGISIGVVAGNLRNTEIKEFFRENKLDYSVREFATAEEAQKALLTDRFIEAIYTSSMRNMDKERVVLRINPHPFYAVVQKGDTELCRQLDGALEEIAITNPQFDIELHKKYYSSMNRNSLNWTKEEQSYMKANRTVYVGIDANFVPIEYYNRKTNEPGGISADVLREISKITGLEFKVKTYTRYEEATESTGENSIQMIASFGEDYEWADKNNMRLTSEYLNLPVSVLTQHFVKDYTDPKLRLAAVKDYYLAEKVTSTITYKEVIYFDTMEECVEAVNEGAADVTYIPTYSADFFTSHAHYTQIRTYAAPEFNYGICFAVPKNGDTVLYKIMNKAVNYIPSSHINSIVFKNILFDEKKWDPLEYVYKYPVFVVTMICLFWLGLMAVSFYSWRMKMNIRQERLLSDEKLYIALAQTNLLVWDYDFAHSRITISQSGKKWKGLKGQIENVPISLIEAGYVHPDHKEPFLHMFDEILSGERVASGLYQVVKIALDGSWTDEYIWVEVKLTNIFNKEGKPIHAVGLLEDVTEKVKEELRLRDKASRDPLTNLLNRTSFQAHVQEFLKKSYEPELISALIIIDTDDFKSANDMYGHYYGDEVLIGISDKLRQLFRHEDCLGRLGGDEFVIFMKNITSVDIIEEKARQVCANLVFEKEDLITTCSVGIAVLTNREVEYDHLYRCADEAMYDAKKKGKKKYVMKLID